MKNKFLSFFITQTSLFENDIPTKGRKVYSLKHSWFYNLFPFICVKENKHISNFYNFLKKRRTLREFCEKKIKKRSLLNILIYSYGINNDLGFRYTPSAGALYPIKFFIYINNVSGIKKGLYLYLPELNKLILYQEMIDKRNFDKIFYNQDFVIKSNAIIVFVANFNLNIEKYGQRGIRYVFLDAGHIAQNISLIALKENLKSVLIGGFLDYELKLLLNLDNNDYPIYAIAIGDEI
jgi:SagB-type dehydrogenase family enzyme